MDTVLDIAHVSIFTLTTESMRKVKHSGSLRSFSGKYISWHVIIVNELLPKRDWRIVRLTKRIIVRNKNN